jgi:hypothetical protein
MNKRVLALIVLLVFLHSGCFDSASQENQILETTLEVNGIIEKIQLQTAISLPVGEEDAEFLTMNCPECNEGDLEMIAGFWTLSCCEDYPVCITKVEASTGKIFCELYG